MIGDFWGKGNTGQRRERPWYSQLRVSSGLKKFWGFKEWLLLTTILTLVHVKHCSVQVGLVQAQNIELESNDKEQSDLEIKQLT